MEAQVVDIHWDGKWQNEDPEATFRWEVKCLKNRVEVLTDGELREGMLQGVNDETSFVRH